MRPHRSVFLLLLWSALYIAPGAAQVTGVGPSERIQTAIDDRIAVTRSGNVHPLARPQFDRGTAPGETRMDRMVLLLAPDPVQRLALETLLDAQQNPASPEYHQWLTPEAFGRNFGVSDRDLARIVDWLEGHGFQVEPPAASHREMVFSGTAAQVSTAFHTEMHMYQVGGERHFANATDPRIPLALADVVAGVVSLHDFVSRPQHSIAPAADPRPEFNGGGSHYLGPADFATIYDVAALYSQAIDGTGQSVAVLGRTDLKLADVQSFRSQFGLPAKNVNVVLNGPDPGILSVDEQVEATLDVEWAGAVAKNATVQFVVSKTTYASDGVALSAQYAVNRLVAPVVSLSFGTCEGALGSAGNQFWNALWQQAAAEGITVLVAAGDSGAAGCDSPSNSTATGGAAINGLCSSPYSTCVGGTQFSDTSSPNTYWSTTSNPTNQGSALSYIPEAVWNQSGSVAGGAGLWSAGGGSSLVYSKPAWQTGPGVPPDGHRDVPDISLSGSTHDGYLIVLNGQLVYVGGTSCSTPATAGLMTLVVQKTSAAQGNANPRLYALGALEAQGGADVFHDIQVGNDSVPGVAGFSAGPGYDLATGLGSVDATLLVNHWNDPTGPAAPTLGLSPSTASISLLQGASTNVTLAVTGGAGFNAAVVLSGGTIPPGLTAGFTPSSIASPGSGSVTLKLTAGAGMATGTYQLTLGASGGGLAATAPLSVTILQNCQFGLSPTSVNEPAGAGNYSAAITSQNGCTWTAATNTSWIALPSGASGAGIGTLSYSLAANSTTSQRTGSITVAGLTLTVTQAAPAVFRLSSTGASAPAAGGTGTVAVSPNSTTASWTATSNANWITITKGASGNGPGTVTYSVAGNTVSAARTGTLTIAGIQFTISQSGSGQTCTYKLAFGTITTTNKNYSGTVSVTTGSACQWTASSNVPWLTISSGASGTGNGMVSYLAAPNTTSATRIGTLTVAGVQISFTEGPGSTSRASVRKP